MTDPNDWRVALTDEERAYRRRMAEQCRRTAEWSAAASAAFLRAPLEYDEWKRHHPPPRIGDTR